MLTKMDVYEKQLQQRLDKVEDDFFNSSYETQIKLYRLALHIEYYEFLANIVKRLHDLPEEFLYDVEHLK